MAKRRVAKVSTDTPSQPKPSLTVSRRKISGKVGKMVTLTVRGKVVEENLGEEWETPKRPTKRIQISSIKQNRSRRRK